MQNTHTLYYTNYKTKKIGRKKQQSNTKQQAEKCFYLYYEIYTKICVCVCARS